MPNPRMFRIAKISTRQIQEPFKLLKLMRANITSLIEAYTGGYCALCGFYCALWGYGP